MLRRWFIESLSVLLVTAIVTSAAAEGGWKIPNLLPFQSKKPKPAKQFTNSNSMRTRPVRPASHSWTDYRDIARRRKKASSPVGKIAEGTKKFHEQTTRTVSQSIKKIGDDTKQLLDQTKQLLMPWADDGKKSSRRAKPLGNTTKRDDKGNGFFSAPRFWTSTGKPKKTKAPLTMSEWIGQDRPGQ
jgi:hypothetical protein